MFIEAVGFFLGVSILLYFILAGADFGAGMLEFFLGREKQNAQREVITHAVGPVWEANHVWLILALVILFNGFPKVFSSISIYFHIPLILMLFGIIMRGCAFTFRHYDAVKDESQKYYSAIFILSSFITPFSIGLVGGGMFLGRIDPHSLDYRQLYINPWMNVFCASMGIFICALFAFLAAVYLLGETKDRSLRLIFIRRAKWANFIALISGFFVFIAAELDHFSLIQRFFQDRWSAFFMVIATLILIPLWRSIHSDRVLSGRVWVAIQVILVLMGWFKIQFPVLLSFSDSSVSAFTLYNSAAPSIVLKYLLYALVAGSLLIFPAMGFLFKVFKLK